MIFHMLAELCVTLVLVTCANTVEAVACSPFWSDYAAVEGFILHLIWPVAYPAMAGIPLSISVPFQIFICLIYNFQVASQCSGALLVCKKSDQQYKNLSTLLAKIGNSMPFNFPPVYSLPSQGECLNVLLTLEIAMVVVISLYLCFHVELSSRLAFCVATGKDDLHFELEMRECSKWQIMGEILALSVLAWYVASSVTNIWFWFIASPIKSS